MSAEQSTVRFKDLPGFPGYRVDSEGNVWSCRKFSRNPAGEWRRLYGGRSLSGAGYFQVRLFQGGRSTTHSVHRLVLLAFVGPCPEGQECLHSNGVRTDNRLANLSWGTRAANMADSAKHGTLKSGEQHYKAKLTEKNVRLIRDLYAEGNVTLRDLAERHGINSSTLHNVVTRKTWKHVS